jgi:transposase
VADPCISIPLGIADVKVLSVDVDESGAFHIRIESTCPHAHCHKCGKLITKFHGFDDEIRLRHLPILDRPVYLFMRPKRFLCDDCKGGPTTTQRLDWYNPRSSTTKAYDKYLTKWLIRSTLEDVSRKEDIPYDVVRGVLDRMVDSSVRWDELAEIPTMGIDEIALRKGHGDFVTIITAKGHTGQIHLLGVVEGRCKDKVAAFLSSIPHRLKKTVLTVHCDLYEGYINAAKQQLPRAKVVADRFHVAKLYHACVDDLRKSEMAALKKRLPKEQLAELKGIMWPLRMNCSDIDDEQEELLDKVFSHSEPLRKSYEEREELTAIFEEDLSRDEAVVCLRQWSMRVRESGLKCFDSFLITLERHEEEIANYFEGYRTSGFVEGINNKLKVLKRRCFGLLNLRSLFQRLWLDLEGDFAFGLPV